MTAVKTQSSRRRRRSSTSSPRAATRPDPASLDGFARFANDELTLEDGSAFRLEPFQRELLADYFAGTAESLVLLPKKNGKSTLLAALALHHLLVTADAECVIAAASRDQATILYDQAGGFIRRSEKLQAVLDVKRGYREIRSVHDAGRFRVLASDVDTVDGVIPTLALVDELHRHKSADLYGVFRDGLGPRAGRMITISTAGDDEASPLGVMRQAARELPGATRDGCHWHGRSPTGAYAMHEWALDPADDRDDMAVVKEANPASWQTVEALARRHDSPSMTSWQWARFACGVWLQGQDSAVKPEEWDALWEPGVEIPDGAGVWVGVDLGWKVDTTALVPLWPEREGRHVIGPPAVLEPPGDGSLLDDRLIVSALLGMAARWRILGVVYDPNAGGQQMVQQLERDHAIRFVEHSQDNSPIALADGRLMEAIRRRSLAHDGDRTLRMHVLNAVEKPLGGEKFRFDRARRGPRKPIDALRALAMAHSVAVANARPPDMSVAFL